MKNFLFALVAGSISALAVTNEGYAQVTNSMASVELRKHVFKLRAISPENENVINMYAINSKAVKDLKKSYKELKSSYNAAKDFKSSYKTTGNEKWYKVPDGFMAAFTSNGISNKVFYDKKGQWSASLKKYSEDKADQRVKDIFQSGYSDYKINCVEEIETRDAKGTPTYLFDAEDDNNIKIVRISGEEMDVYQGFKKQK